MRKDVSTPLRKAGRRLPTRRARQAKSIARQALSGIRDRFGEPVLEHSVAVSEEVEDAPARIAGLLHDLLEDTDWTADDLRERGVPELSVRAVEIVTRKDGESYPTFIERVATARGAEGDLARAVKIADTNHNLSRVGQLPPGEREALASRYCQALERLTAAASRRAHQHD
jgi:(p)ppGpp synthase/HD superfamily hydrolase